MIPYRNTIRYWLQGAAQLQIPRDFRPFNRKWSFDRKRHTTQLRRYIKRLRDLADGMEAWLDK